MYEITWPFCLYCTAHVKDDIDTVFSDSFKECLSCFCVNIACSIC